MQYLRGTGGCGRSRGRDSGDRHLDSWSAEVESVSAEDNDHGRSTDSRWCPMLLIRTVAGIPLPSPQICALLQARAGIAVLASMFISGGFLLAQCTPSFCWNHILYRYVILCSRERDMTIRNWHMTEILLSVPSLHVCPCSA